MNTIIRKSVCLLAILFPILFAGAGMTDEEETKAKDHHFFVGVRLEIEHEGEMYPMVGIRGNQILIVVDGEIVEKPIGNLGQMRYKKEAKLTNNLVYIDNLECEEAYSPAADPQVQAARTNMMLAEVADQQLDSVVSSQLRMNDAQTLLSTVESGGGVSGPGAGDVLAFARYQAKAANSSFLSARTKAGVNPGSLGGTQLESQKDVLKVSFDISSDKDIEDPYLLMIASLKESEEAKPEHGWFHFRPLDNIKANELEEIRFTASSFPDGMLVDDYEIFLFSGAVEIPSNLSSKKVDLTRSDAHLFMTYQYVNRNYGKTMPPKPIRGTMSRRILNYQKKDLLDRTIRVKIDQEGNVTGFKVEGDQTKSSEELSHILRILEQTMFYPALEDGETVEGEYLFVLRKEVAELGDHLAVK